MSMSLSTLLWHQSDNNWLEQEISDLLDYLLYHGSTAAGTFHNLATHLAQRYPDQNWTVAAIQSKFNSLKEIAATIDHYNRIFGNSPKHDNILITPLEDDQEALNLLLQSAQGQELDTLVKYCNNPFPHYHKLRVLRNREAGNSEAEHLSDVVQSMESLVIGPLLFTTKLPSHPQQAPSEFPHVLSGYTPFSTSSTLEIPPLSPSDHMQSFQSSPMAFSQDFSSSLHHSQEPSTRGFEAEHSAFRHYSPMPPSSASSHDIFQSDPGPASVWWVPPAPVLNYTQETQLINACHQLAGELGSQRPDSTEQQKPCGSQPSVWSTRMENDTGSSAGAMNHSTSDSRLPYYVKVTNQAIEYIYEESSLSEEQQALLCIYYGKHIPEAAALLSSSIVSKGWKAAHGRQVISSRKIPTTVILICKAAVHCH